MYDLTQQKPKVGCLWRIISVVGAIVVIGIVLIIVIAVVGGSKTKPPPVANASIAILKPQTQEVTFEELARNTERYTGKLLYFTGEVIQVVEDSGNYTMRINVTKKDFGWNDPILVLCNCPVRPLEQDKVEFIAEVDGRHSYKTVLGATVTLPMVTAKAFKIVE